MAFIISVLHNFFNIFMYTLCSFAYFTQSPASSIVHLLYQNDTFSTYIVSFVYCFCLDFVHPGHMPSPALSPLLLPAAVLFCSKIPFPPQGGPARSCFMLRDVLSRSTKTAGPVRVSRCLPHPYSFYLQVRSRRPGTRPWYPPDTVLFSTRS